MNYKYIIMNPPYNGNLHLMILDKATESLTKDGLCVNLSPIRWLQDPLAEYKNKSVDWYKFESIRNHIKSLDVIDALWCQYAFNIILGTNLGIYTCCFNYEVKEKIDVRSPLVMRISKYNQTHKPVFEENKKDGWRVRVPIITGGRSGGKGIRQFKLRGLGSLIAFYNGEKNGIKWYDYYQRNQFSKLTDEITWSVKFETEQEAENFISSMDTTFAKWYTNEVIQDIHVCPEQVLWLDDYSQKWANERLCKYFNVSGYIDDTQAEPGSEWDEVLTKVHSYDNYES